MKDSQMMISRRVPAKRIRHITIVLATVALATCMTVALPGVGSSVQTRAWANDVAGALAPVTDNLSSAATTVELYRVQVSGGIGGAVGVGDALTAAVTKRPSYTLVEEGDDVSYQWQYANTSTGADDAYSDIEGATSATYTVTSDMLGKYLRVKATSQNVVVSTSKPYGGTTLPENPLGPVQAAVGAVQLDSVSLVSTLSNSMWVGAVVTPTAMYLPSGSNISIPVPQDAAVTYTWKVADSASGPFVAFDANSFAHSSVSASGELSIGSDLAGKYVRLEANALMNTVSSLTWPVLPQGVYDLMRITFGFDTLYTGNTIVTQLQAKTLEYESDYSFGTTVPVDDPNASYQWYSTPDEPKMVGDSLNFSDCTWTPIEGATGADLVIPESAVGCYVKVVATSSKDGVGTSVERASTTRVLVGGSLQQAIEKLGFFHPTPVWNEATNMNDIVAEKLAKLGYADVRVKTKSFERSANDEKANLDVSTADDSTNGDVSFFTYDGVDSASSHNFAIHHQVRLVFELSREGESPVQFECTTNIPWNLDAAKTIVDGQMQGLSVDYVEGDSSEAVTQNVSLPCKTGILWVTWASSDEDSIRVYRDESSPASLWDPYTGIVSRGAEDVPVVLTANVDATLVDTADDTLASLSRSIEFPLTVKGDAEMIANMNAALAAAIDARFTYGNVKLFATGAAIDENDVRADLQLPTTRTLFGGSDLSSDDYKVAYSSDNENAIVVNGYRAVVMRPLPSANDLEVSIAVTVTHKKISAVQYTKALAFTLTPLDEAEIDADIAFMEQAKESVFAGYSEGQQEQDAVTSNLHAFQRAYFDDEGQLHWKYAANDTADAACATGFTPQTVDDRPSSDASYARFVSSHPGIVADDTLRVTRTTRDIGVSVTCCLTSDRFGSYYVRYKEDTACPEELKEKLGKLYRQKVTCAITVKGTQVATAVIEELLQAADDAEAQTAGVSVSEDGSDVLQDVEWVDAATMKELQDSITLARALAEKDGVTDAEIQAAQSRLAEALVAFTAARKPGLCTYATEQQKADLSAAADDADALLGAVYSSVDGSDIASDKKWAPEDVVDRLANAIDAVRTLVAAGSASESDINIAAGELALARAAFERCVKMGLQSAPGPVVRLGASYVAGIGASKAVYQVKSTANGSTQGTVWYLVCKAPKQAKSALVPATVSIGGATYRVVGIATGAFKSMKKLSKVTIGKNVAKIDKSAFYRTPKLKKLIVKSIALGKKACVKKALKGSKAHKLTVKVPKKTKKTAKKVFTKKNLAAPKVVKVK